MEKIRIRKFLIRLGIFLVPISIFFFSIEFLNRKANNEYKVKVTNFEKARNNTKVLFLGSSHALRAINPEFIPNSFNLAMVSQSLYIDYLLIKKYKKELNALKAIVLTISHFSLSQNLKNGELVNRLPFYYHFYELADVPISKIDKSFILPTVGYDVGTFRALKYIFNYDQNVLTKKYGYMGEGGYLATDSLQFLHSAKITSLRHEDGSINFSENIKLITEIATWAAKNDIILMMIETPKTKEYELMLDRSKSELINKSLRDIESKFNNVYYKDFTSLFDSKEYFRNADHLNEKGASNFSKILNMEIDELLKE